jgi:hypothetical protein
LFKKISNFIASWCGLIRLYKLSKSGIRVAFYAEGNAYKAFLVPVIKTLTTDLNLEICYLTSDPNDTFLLDPPHNVSPIYIGWGSAMILAFQTLEFDVLAMTMPDLNSFHIKRSFHQVHYIYLQHSLVSSHMVYRTGAFDHFDSILCSGPHQIAEIREWEKINNLPAKELYEHGYAPLETIMKGFASHLHSPSTTSNNRRVLVAPSWGPEGVIDRGAAPLIECLLEAGHYVTLRPHPQSLKTSFAQIEHLKNTFTAHPNFIVDNDTSMFDILYDTDVLISDWSGIALEFAFGLERPVIFIDVPRKVNNPRYSEMKNIPLEVTIREQLGVILASEKLDTAAELVAWLSKDPQRFAEQARKLRKKYVFNLKESALIGAHIIKKISEKQK